NLILIPKMGVLGAVVATLVTQFAVCLAQFWKAHQLFRLNVTNKETFKVIIYVAVAIFSFGLLHSFGQNWYLSLMALTALNLTFAFLIGLLDFKFFINILKFRA